MGWQGRLFDQAKPLVAAAERFLARHDLGALDGFRPGPDGLVRLAGLIDTWCEQEEPGEEADRAFVEGAGALLGLLLLDHVGEGEHVAREGTHRVRLGPRGFFDPFTAIEVALEADDPRATLAAAVREAEAEARGEGTKARVVMALERRLEVARPTFRVAEHFEQYVRLVPNGLTGDMVSNSATDDTGLAAGDVELDLDRVVRSTVGQDGAAVEQAVEKLVAMLPGGDTDGPGTALPWEEAESRILPRLVGRPFVETLEARGEGRGTLWLAPVGHDVSLALLVDHGGRARYLRTDEVEGWPLAEAAVQRRALENLASRSANARFARVDTPEGPLVVARTGDGLDAARLLLPSLHDVLAPELGSPFLAAAPHRDTLLATARSSALARALEARARDDAARAPHAISSALFEVTPTGLREA